LYYKTLRSTGRADRISPLSRQNKREEAAKRKKEVDGACNKIKIDFWIHCNGRAATVVTLLTNSLLFAVLLRIFQPILFDFKADQLS
jgi:hypothetical protein